jgi:hypothetical protein
MGKLLIFAKYIFLVYGTDIYESRKHIHITYTHRGFKRSCKFWLEPKVELDENKKGDFTEVELNEIKNLISENKNILLKQLELFYNHKPVKAIRK